MTAPSLSLPGFADRAACAETDPEAFFPKIGGNATQAKRICSACPVQAECLEWALAHPERHGVWGGLSERERRGLTPAGPVPASLARQPERKRGPIPHGTPAGYTAHYRRHEPMCEPCRQAQLVAKAARKKRAS